MIRNIASVVLMTAGLLICAGAEPTTNPSMPRHLADAQALVNGIASKDNVYEHKGCFIKWKGENGATKYENRSDCSDFLALLLEHSYSTTKEQIKEWTGETRPYANAWHDAITSEKGFTQIKKLEDARPGDVFAIKFPKGLADTGHVMLMAGKAEPVPPAEPIVKGTRQWNVIIIDSSKFAHGNTDTRYIAKGIGKTGVGRGVVRIYTNPDGTVAGYTWTDRTESKFEAENDRNIAIGRLKIAE